MIAALADLPIPTVRELQGAVDRVTASAELEISPRDDVSLGLTIDDLGKRMLRSEDEARQALDAIHDRRTITHWRQAIASDDPVLFFEHRLLYPVKGAKAFNTVASIPM